MKQHSLLRWCAVCVVVSVACSLGCAHSISSEATTIRQATWQADLDDCREVRLSVNRVYEHERGEQARAYEQLTVELRPRSYLSFESVLKSIELAPGQQRGRLRFDGIEVRADESRSKVWFVDVGSGRVVTTLDRDTGVTTGPDDEPPAWAIADGGILLSGGE
ncbi:MAG: hypothetical protein JXB46_11410 [Candidatus Eisenbacteria bacterium]|nr:hypothetical protein [Candidatus Eisenbacteria bacterium]